MPTSINITCAAPIMRIIHIGARIKLFSAMANLFMSALGLISKLAMPMYLINKSPNLFSLVISKATFPSELEKISVPNLAIVGKSEIPPIAIPIIKNPKAFQDQQAMMRFEHLKNEARSI